MISPARSRFVADLNQLAQLAYSDLERYNAANPDEPIDFREPMPVYSAREDGIFIDGVKDDDYSAIDVPDDFSFPELDWAVRESPDQSFRFREPEPPYQPLPGQGRHEGAYVSPYCELNGDPIELNPNWYKWPVRLRRKQEGHVVVEKIIYIGGACSIALAAWSSPGSQGFGFIAIGFLFFIIPWLEWSSRCENREQVMVVGVALNAAIIAWKYRPPVVREPSHPLRRVPVAPVDHRRPRHSDLRRDRRVRLALRGQQHDPRPLRQPRPG